MTGLLLLWIALSEPEYVLKGYDRLPHKLPVTQEQVLEMLVPSYVSKAAESRNRLKDPVDPSASKDTYEAAVVSYRRTNLGIQGEDFLLVAILEIDSSCRSCRHTVLGGVDLRHKVSLGSVRSDEPSIPADSRPVLDRNQKPWRVSFRYAFGSSDARCGVEWVQSAALQPVASGGFRLGFEPPISKRVGSCDVP